MQSELTRNQKELLKRSVKVDKFNNICGELECKVCGKTIYWRDIVGEDGDEFLLNGSRAKADVYITTNQNLTSTPPYTSAKAEIYVECPHCHYKIKGETEIIINKETNY